MLPAFLLLLAFGAYVAQATTVEKMTFSEVVGWRGRHRRR